MSNVPSDDIQLDRYPWRELFGEPVVAQLRALHDAARDIAAMRARERLRRLREAHACAAELSTDHVLSLLLTRINRRN